MPRLFFRDAPRTPLALATMLALLAIPYTSTRLRAFRVAEAPWDREADAVAAVAPAADDATKGPASAPPLVPFQLGEKSLEATENERTVSNALPEQRSESAAQDLPTDEGVARPIEDPSGHALDPFYEALARTLRKEPGAVTRVLHYGDSIIAGDLISGTMRRRMQEAFGDAGHGFILIANPWAWYFQNDVAHGATAGWGVSRLTGPWPDDHYFGLGGASFTTAGGSAWFGTAARGDYGQRVSRFDLYYLEQPHGGDVWLTLPGRAPERFSTRGPAKVSRVKSIAVPDGPSTLTVKGFGNGPLRLFGVAMERDVPGVAYDALGVHAAKAQYWEVQDEAHWKDQLALRKPSLIVLQFGTNESEEPKLTSARFAVGFNAVVDKVKRVSGGAAVLVVSPPDRAVKGGGGELRSAPIIPQLVSAERDAALAHGVAFWNTFEAMGGAGSMGRWRKTTPPLANGDLSHPTPAGGEVLGKRLFEALVRGYRAYAEAHPDAPRLPASLGP